MSVWASLKRVFLSAGGSKEGSTDQLEFTGETTLNRLLHASPEVSTAENQEKEK